MKSTIAKGEERMPRRGERICRERPQDRKYGMIGEGER
jgi:hypothetical protein